MRIRVLGPTEVESDDGTHISITAAKPRRLLEFLALDAGHNRSSAAICEVLWGEDEPQTAMNLVQGYVSDLRRQLGRDRIATTPTGYSLTVPRENVDALEFGDLVEQAAAEFPRDFDRCEMLVAKAIQLWNGPALEDAANHGRLEASATRLNEQLLDAKELKAALDLALGRHSSAIAELEALTKQNPFRERFWVQLATALYRSDRQAEALRRCSDARRLLLDELGLSPGPELARIEQRILEHDVSLMDWRRASGNEVGEGSASVVSLSHGFVGRTENLDVLAGLLDGVRNGAQHLVFVGGEPGIGKTALVDEFVGRAGESAVVLIGRSDEHVTAPYLAFEQALSDHLGGLDAKRRAELISDRIDDVAALLPSLKIGATSERTSSPEFTLIERFEMFRWVLDQLRSLGPLIIVLEDVHWADSMTLGLVRYLAEGQRLAGSLVVATYRTSDASPILEDLLADLRPNDMVERMLLDGLRGDALRELVGPVTSANDTIEWIESETEGNPFFVRELVRHAVETGSFDGVPAGIVEVVKRRVRRLTPPAQELLVRAAILGDDAPVGLLRLLSVDLENLSELFSETVHAGILAESDTTEPRYRFSHSIIRKAAEASVTMVRRQDLHLAAAHAWEEFRGGRAEPSTIAAHYLDAGSAAPREAALAAFVAAGDYFDTAGAKVEAVGWYDHALSLLDEDDPRSRKIRLRRFVVAQAAWHWHYDRRSIVRANAQVAEPK